MRNDTHHHLERFPAVVSKCLFKLWWLLVAVPRSTKHPPPPSPPPPPAFSVQISVAGQQWELWLMKRVVQHSVPVSEFLLRRGNAPTRPRACSKNTRDNTRPHLNSCCLKQTSEIGNGACYSIVNNSILELMDCQRASIHVHVYCIICLQSVEGCVICYRIHYWENTGEEGYRSALICRGSADFHCLQRKR